MKKISYILFALAVLASPVFSQSEVDALRFSREDLYGTARSMSMGGAFGALGGDLTGVSINPAGIAVYRSSEVVGTLNLSGEKSTAEGTKVNKTRFDMDNIGFVGYFPLRNEVMPLINFGFSYNKAKSFDKKVSGAGQSRGTLVDYIYNDYLGAVDRGVIKNDDDLLWVENEYDPFLSQPWLPALGRNTFLIHPNQDGTGLVPLNTNGEKPNNFINTRESGQISNYDITVGTTIANVLNVGIALSIKDISYRSGTAYDEEYSKGGYTLLNEQSVSGTGVGAKLGVIYRPTNMFRLGFAWHSPTRYAMSETYFAEMLHDVKAYLPNYVKYDERGMRTAEFRSDYDLRTPGKFVISAATVVGHNFIASVDYEWTDYSKMKLMVPSNSWSGSGTYDADNEVISTDYKAASTVRAGIEYRFTQQFSGRLGYAWMQNPNDADYEKLGQTAVPGSNTIHRIEGDAQYITGGLGYRFNRNFYLDMAVVYKTQKDDLYPFPNFYGKDGKLVVDASPFSLKNNSIRGLVTLGYKF